MSTPGPVDARARGTTSPSRSWRERLLERLPAYYREEPEELGEALEAAASMLADLEGGLDRSRRGVGLASRERLEALGLVPIASATLPRSSGGTLAGVLDALGRATSALARGWNGLWARQLEGGEIHFERSRGACAVVFLPPEARSGPPAAESRRNAPPLPSWRLPPGARLRCVALADGLPLARPHPGARAAGVILWTLDGAAIGGAALGRTP